VWLKNIWLKLTALALAVLLWFHVATNRVYNHTVELDLEAGPVPPGFALASPLPGRITLILAGTGKELIRFIWDGGSAKYLIEPTMSGPCVVSPDRLLLRMDADVQIEQVLDPTMVSVRVDSVIAVRLPVRVNAEYTLGQGYALENDPRVIPNVVTASGPSANVLALSSISTQPLQAGELKSPVELRAALDLKDVFNVHLQPETVRIVFDVVTATQK
jgi:hypothetical protein